MVVATPPQATLEVAAAALASGARVLVEKPGARSRGEIEQLAKPSNGTLAGFAYNYRFHPAIQRMRAMLTAERAPLRRLELRFVAPLSAGNSWRASREAGGGALRDLGTHLLDLATWLTGKPLQIDSAEISSHHTEHDEARVCLRAGDTAVDLHCAYHGRPQCSLRAELETTALLTDLWALAGPVRLSNPRTLPNIARLWTSRLISKIPGQRPAQALRESRCRMLAAAVHGGGWLASPADAMAVLGWVEQVESSAHR